MTPTSTDTTGRGCGLVGSIVLVVYAEGDISGEEGIEGAAVVSQGPVRHRPDERIGVHLHQAVILAFLITSQHTLCIGHA